jgi:hypothetical protein
VSLPAWLSVGGITIIIGVVSLYWTFLPEQGKYRVWLWTRRLRFDLSLEAKGPVKPIHHAPQYILKIHNPGMSPKYPVYLRTIEPSVRWFVVFDPTLRRTSGDGANDRTNTEDNPRVCAHLLPSTDDGAKIGFYVYYDDPPVQKTYREWLRYEFVCLGITISKNALEIP